VSVAPASVVRKAPKAPAHTNVLRVLLVKKTANRAVRSIYKKTNETSSAHEVFMVDLNYVVIPVGQESIKKRWCIC